MASIVSACALRHECLGSPGSGYDVITSSYGAGLHMSNYARAHADLYLSVRRSAGVSKVRVIKGYNTDKSHRTYGLPR
jgi:hypothetical protein